MDRPIDSQEFAPEQALACRCEEISLAEIALALAAGAETLNDLKRRTRAGMGICQGIYCMPAIAAMAAQATGKSIDSVAPMTTRPPVRPTLIDELAKLEDLPWGVGRNERTEVGD